MTSLVIVLTRDVTQVLASLTGVGCIDTGSRGACVPTPALVLTVLLLLPSLLGGLSIFGTLRN